MATRSNSIFHFTKDIDSLKSIISNGFWPKYCPEDVSWMGYSEFNKAAYPMVCFCDIPISRISEHVDFYGKYGIGLCQKWGIGKDLNPVIYFSRDNVLHQAFKYLYDLAIDVKNDKEKKIAIDALWHFLGYVKPIIGDALDRNKKSNVQKNFLQESEWRYVPVHDKIVNVLDEAEYLDLNNRALRNNEVSKLCCLEFKCTDIKYIFVDKDDEIPLVINHILDAFSDQNDDDIKKLVSRVTSLDMILNDV